MKHILIDGVYRHQIVIEIKPGVLQKIIEIVVLRRELENILMQDITIINKEK